MIVALVLLMVVSTEGPEGFSAAPSKRSALASRLVAFLALSGFHSQGILPCLAAGLAEHVVSRCARELFLDCAKMRADRSSSSR